MIETHAPVLVRMTIEQKEQLQQAAHLNGRTLTGEINARLQISLSAHGPTLQGILAREAFAKPVEQPTHKVEQERASYGNGTISDLDRAMLSVFRAMPVEKQLALLSLFK